MSHRSSLVSFASRQSLWSAFLCAASVALTLGFSCAAPLAALGAIAALTMSRRAALLTTGAAWLANQAAGFTVLNYPMDGVTLAWGAALGVTALATCEAAGFAARRATGRVAAGAAFLAAFAVHEVCLVMTSVAAQSGLEDFSAEIVARILAINAVAFAILFAVNRLAAPIGRASKPLVVLASGHA